MTLGLKGAVTAELEAVEGDVDEILVQEQVLALLVGEDDHERLDQRVPQHVLNRLDIIGINLLNVYLFELFSVDRSLLLLGADLGPCGRVCRLLARVAELLSAGAARFEQADLTR